MDRKLQTAVKAAMLAAMTTIATMVIKVPTLGTNGYVNIGDTLVLISAWILGNPYGALAAGIGSALADLLSGYPVYIPGTAVIKFLMAFAASAIFGRAVKYGLHINVSYIASSIAAELIMVLGYFLYESTVLGYGIAASASIISNAAQGITCLILGNVLIWVLPKKFRSSFVQDDDSGKDQNDPRT
ncbi:MAG: ECF transporter S component [Lachnospiraceae bacterium]|nr:ECF transporter S component [Lachnospiraceae bacterium]